MSFGFYRSDGATLTLRPDSQFRFDTYRYSPGAKTAQNTSLLSLVKGAFRSITGYMGRANRAGYSIATPTATIGIRGTDHELAYYPPPGPGEKMDHDPGTYDKVNDGESFIRNPKGEVSVRPGQFAFVHANGRVAPRILQRPPAFYQRHAEIDKRAAVRRQEFHRKFEERHQRRLQDRQQRPEKGLPKDEQRRDLREKRQPEHQTQIEQREKLVG